MNQADFTGFSTQAVRVGHERSPEGEHSEPIFLTSSYVFANAEEAAARFSGDMPGNIYSRFTNPTVQTFERRLAALEGGACCVATASGMSAILSICIVLLRAGDHVICSQSVFGTTVSLFNNYLPRFGIEVSFVKLTELADWEQAIRPNTRMLFLETPSNPLTEIADIAAIAQLAHSNECQLVVDNCFCSPALQQPFKFGADIVVHSATKNIDGQGRCVGGAVVGPQDIVGTDVFAFMRTAGPAMSPFNAWVFLKGLETLSLRMRAQSDTASTLAPWLEQHAKVTRVYYPGLESHPQHALAIHQQSHFGNLLAFDLKGGKQAAWAFINATKMVSITANLGDVKTTITHPATTTHARLTPEERQQAGIGDGLVRMSIGLESMADIRDDLERGFDSC